MALPEGVTLTGAGRRWARAAPEQEVARWPPAACGSSRAGPITKLEAPPPFTGWWGFHYSALAEMVREIGANAMPEDVSEEDALAEIISWMRTQMGRPDRMGTQRGATEVNISAVISAYMDQLRASSGERHVGWNPTDLTQNSAPFYALSAFRSPVPRPPPSPTAPAPFRSCSRDAGCTCTGRCPSA
jgi:hypothetical protein